MTGEPTRMLRLALTVQSPDGTFAGVTVEQENAIIGSDARADLQLQTPGVAGIHAIVRQAAGAVTLVDVGAAAGIWRHGQRLRGEIPLLDGDTFVIDGHAIAVSFRGAVADAAPPDDSTTDQTPSVGPDADRGSVADPGPAAAEPLSAIERAPFEPTLVDTAPAAAPEHGPHPLATATLAPADRPGPHDRLLEVVALWHGDLIDVGYVRPPTPATAGSGPGCTVHVPAPIGSDGPLVLARATPTGYVVAGEPGRELESSDRAAVQRGPLQFIMRYVASGAPARVRRSHSLDLRYTAVLACSLMAHALFAWSIQITPRHHHRMHDDLLGSALRTVRTHLSGVLGQSPRPRPPSGGQKVKTARRTPTFSIQEPKKPPAKAELAPAMAEKGKRPEPTDRAKRPRPGRRETAPDQNASAAVAAGDPALPPGPPAPATMPQPSQPEENEIAVANVELTINADGARSCGIDGPGAPVTAATDVKTQTLAWPASLLAPFRTRPPLGAYLSNLRVLGRIGPRALGSYRVALPNDVIRVELDEPGGASLYVGRTDARCVIVSTITSRPLRVTLRGVPMRLMDARRNVSAAIVDVTMAEDARFELRLREGQPLLFQRGRLANGGAVAATVQAHLKIAQSTR
ncbi:MAG: FHA domain-containing protein [Deltaproteobacteria bacterium]|nr:FHA domain-containing protein [Deltaproteobacteria bacterium]